MSSSRFVTSALAFSLSVAAASATTIFTVEIGTGADQVGNNVAGVGLNSATVAVTGLPAGVTFDLAFSAVGYDGTAAPNSQTGGMGVSGGQANSGIDNNFNGTGGTATVAVEQLTFSILNVSSGSILITGFKSNFSADAGPNTEYFNIDGGAATPFASGAADVAITPATSFTIGALDLDGTGSDSRFVVQQLTLDYTPVPEPGVTMLAALAGLGLLRRRRG